MQMIGSCGRMNTLGNTLHDGGSSGGIPEAICPCPPTKNGLQRVPYRRLDPVAVLNKQLLLQQRRSSGGGSSRTSTSICLRQGELPSSHATRHHQRSSLLCAACLPKLPRWALPTAQPSAAWCPVQSSCCPAHHLLSDGGDRSLCGLPTHTARCQNPPTPPPPPHTHTHTMTTHLLLPRDAPVPLEGLITLVQLRQFGGQRPPRPPAQVGVCMCRELTWAHGFSRL